MRPIITDDVLYLGVVIIYKAGLCVYSACPPLCHKVNIYSSHHPYSHRTIFSSPGESSDTESAEEEETEDMEGLLGSRFNDCSMFIGQCDKFQNRARCVVCQLERVTRAALPCRFHEKEHN